MARHPRITHGDHDPATNDRCPRCEKERRTCKSCVQRRRRAWQLVDRQGHTIREAAHLMRLSPTRVELFVVLERDRLDLLRHRRNSIPTERLRAFIDANLARDPDLTHAELAHHLNMAHVDFERQFGYAAQKACNGAKGKRVSIETATRAVLALGRAPHELEGC